MLATPYRGIKAIPNSNPPNQMLAFIFFPFSLRREKLGSPVEDKYNMPHVRSAVKNEFWEVASAAACTADSRYRRSWPRRITHRPDNGSDSAA